MFPSFNERCPTILEQLPQRSIAVIGDFFQDKYFIIDPQLAEISLETGKIANQVVDIYHSPGAAGSVTSNLSALGVGQIFAIGAIGDDGAGYELQADLAETRVDTRYLVKSDTMFTPTYTKPMRIIHQQHEELERLDIKNRRELVAEIETRIIDHLDTCLPQLDALIIADQVEERNWGVITDNVRNHLIDLARKYPEKIIFADSRARIGMFKHMLLKPNKFEVYRAIHGKSPTQVSKKDAELCGQTLSGATQLPVIVTLENEGASICTVREIIHIPGIKISGPIDSVGAGDSFTAGMVSALCTGASLPDAVRLGITVASITIRKLGTTGTASPQEIEIQLQEMET